MTGAAHKFLYIPGILMIFLLGCATIKGTVTPMEGGQYKSFVSSDSKDKAMRMAANDAKVTCKKAERGGYLVVSQEDSRNGPKELKTGNDVLDAAISISKIGEATRKYTKYEITTVFKCQ